MVCDALKDVEFFTTKEKNNQTYQFQQDRIEALELKVSILEEIIKKNAEEGHECSKQHDHCYKDNDFSENESASIDTGDAVHSKDNDEPHYGNVLYNEHVRAKGLKNEDKNVKKIDNGQNHFTHKKGVICEEKEYVRNCQIKAENIHDCKSSFKDDNLPSNSDCEEACWDGFCEIWECGMVCTSYYDSVVGMLDCAKEPQRTDEKGCGEKMMLYDEVDSVFVQHDNDYDSLWEQITSDDQDDEDISNSSPYFKVKRESTTNDDDMFSLGNQLYIMEQNTDEILDVDDMNNRSHSPKCITTLSHDDILKLNFDVDDSLHDSSYTYERIRTREVAMNCSELLEKEETTKSSIMHNNSEMRAEIGHISTFKVVKSKCNIQQDNNETLIDCTILQDRITVLPKHTLPDLELNTNLKCNDSKEDLSPDKFDYHGDNDEFEWDGLLSIHEEKQDASHKGENNKEINKLSQHINTSSQESKEKGEKVTSEIVVRSQHIKSPKHKSVENVTNMETKTAKATRSKSIRKSISFRLKFKLKSECDEDARIRIEDKNKNNKTTADHDEKEELQLAVNNDDNVESLKSQSVSNLKESNKIDGDKDVRVKRPLFRSLSLKHARDKFRRRSIAKENKNDESDSPEKIIYRPIIEPKAAKEESGNLKTYSSDSCLTIKREPHQSYKETAQWTNKTNKELSHSSDKSKTPNKNVEINDFKAVRHLMQNNKEIMPCNAVKDNESREERFRNLNRAKKNYLKMLQEGTIRFEPMNKLGDDSPDESNTKDKSEKHMDGLENKKKKLKLSQRFKSTIRSIFT